MPSPAETSAAENPLPSTYVLGYLGYVASRLPAVIGDGKHTMDFSRELFKEGVMGTGITYPTVPEGKARVHTIMTATHTKDDLQQALEVLKRVGRRMGIVN